MQFLLNIHCNNAAFEGHGLICEVETILDKVRTELRYGAGLAREGILRDSNGNRVGEWRCTSDEETDTDA